MTKRHTAKGTRTRKAPQVDAEPRGSRRVSRRREVVEGAGEDVGRAAVVARSADPAHVEAYARDAVAALRSDTTPPAAVAEFVRRFQAAYGQGLAADGLYGPATRTALSAILDVLPRNLPPVRRGGNATPAPAPSPASPPSPAEQPAQAAYPAPAPQAPNAFPATPAQTATPAGAVYAPGTTPEEAAELDRATQTDPRIPGAWNFILAQLDGRPLDDAQRAQIEQMITQADALGFPVLAAGLRRRIAAAPRSAPPQVGPAQPIPQGEPPAAAQQGMISREEAARRIREPLTELLVLCNVLSGALPVSHPSGQATRQQLAADFTQIDRLLAEAGAQPLLASVDRDFFNVQLQPVQIMGVELAAGLVDDARALLAAAHARAEGQAAQVCTFAVQNAVGLVGRMRDAFEALGRGVGVVQARLANLPENFRAAAQRLSSFLLDWQRQWDRSFRSFTDGLIGVAGAGTGMLLAVALILLLVLFHRKA